MKQNVKKKETYIPSSNGRDKLHVIVWIPQGEIKAVLQISHGMIEDMERYDHFARFMAARGILVCGNDHLGHGLTAEINPRWVICMLMMQVRRWQQMFIV